MDDARHFDFRTSFDGETDRRNDILRLPRAHLLESLLGRLICLISRVFGRRHRTAVAVASTIADKIGLLAPLDSDLPYAWWTICSYHMDNRVVGVRGIGIYSPGLGDRKNEIFARVCELVNDHVRNKGAEYIIPLGGRFIPYVVDPVEVQKATGAPILNTKAIGFSLRKCA